MDVLDSALRAADPYRVVADALKTADTSTYERVYVVGAGKAGAAMARAAEDVLDKRIAGGIVVTKEGHGGGPGLRSIELVEAAHPVPDKRGVEAASRIVRVAQEAGENCLVLCLLSGGGSALLAAPVEGVGLAD